MRKSTLVRVAVLAALIGIIGITQMDADSRTQDCWQECETKYNQCMANCQGISYLWCAPFCNNQYQTCINGCNEGSGNPPLLYPYIPYSY